MRKATMLRTGLLTGAALGLVMAASGAAQADVIKFRPGFADPAANVNGVNSFNPADDADLDSFQEVETFRWASVNNVIPRSGSPFANSSQWFINIDTGGDGTGDVGDTFAETFSFHLIDVLTAGGAQGPKYGKQGDGSNWDTDGDGVDDAGLSFPTHVFMVVDAEGHLDAPFNDGDTGEDLDLTYTKATFKMFFDEDGDTEGTTGDQTQIAQFGTNDNPAGISDPGTGNQSTLEWTVTWDAVLEGVFQDEGDNEIGDPTRLFDGGPLIEATTDGGAARFMKITTQDVTVADTGLNGNTLEVTIEAQGTGTGQSEINSVPEPGTLALLGAGLLGAGLIGRKRRKAA